MADFDIQDKEEMEGNVYIDEKEAVREEDLFIGKEMQSINNNKKEEEEDDFYENFDEENPEEQKTLPETEKEEDKEIDKETAVKEIKEKPKKENKKSSKSKPKKEAKKSKKKEGGEVKVKNKKSKAKKPAPKKKNKKNKKVSKKKNKKKTKRNYFWPIFLSLIGIAIIVFVIFYVQNDVEEQSEVVAKVNGQQITMQELTKEYEFFFLMGGIPEQYKSEITKLTFLNSSMISEEIIIQESNKLGITVSDEEVDNFLVSSIMASGTSMEQFEEIANSRGLSIEDVKLYLKRQLISYKVLNETVLGEIEVTEEEVEAAYNENQLLFEEQNQTFEDVEEYIIQTIRTQKQRENAQQYMSELRKNANVEIYLENEDVVVEEAEEVVEEETEEIVEEITIDTYTETDDDICYEDGKPLVILFSTTYCPHCAWISNTFDSVVQDYDVAAYHWELDKGDNTLTEEMESTLPKQQIDILKEYNPNGYVPAFVIGCKYVRIGNGYEAENDLEKEEDELRAAIGSLI